MSTLAVTDTNDIEVVNGQMRIATGLEATAMLAKHYAQTLRGEMMHAMTDGIRFYETAFNRLRPALFEADFRRRVMQVPDVVNIKGFEVHVLDGRLLYNATIETIYGTEAISNG